MAREQEKKDIKELIELEEQLSSLRKGNTDASFSATESIRELLGIKSRSLEFDKQILQNSKAISSELLNQETSLSNMASYTRQNIKNEKLLSRQIAINSSIQAKLNDTEKERVKGVLETIKIRDLSIKKELSYESQIVKASGEKKKGLLDLLKGQRHLTKEAEAELDALIDGDEKRKDSLKSDKERTAFFAAYQEENIRANNELRESTLKSIAPAANFLQLLGAIPGLGNIADKALEELVGTTEEIVTEQGKALGKAQAFGLGIKSAGKTFIQFIANPLSIGLALLGSFLNTFNKLNTSQTTFRRLTGESAKNILNQSTSLTSGVDNVETLVGLTQQFGLNANRAFSEFNIREATELRELMGISAESANRLALFAEITGDNLDTAASNIYDGVSAGISQQQILEQIGSISDSIAITFKGNLELMGATANEAKKLGLNLSQVDQIASGLLDIESSIAAEFEAEVISGKQLNFERARFFALTNNLAGVTEEIGKNQEIINTFATGSRIEQEAIASALNLSRDEISSMIFQQSLLNGLSEEEAAIRSGMTIDDAKRLSVQDSLAKSLEKISFALAPIAEMIAAALSNTTALYTIFGSLAAISLLKTVGAFAQLAVSAGTIGVALGGFGAIAIAAGIVATIAAITSGIAKAKQTGDAIIPAGKGPIISTREGGLIQGTANDDVIMAPGIARGGRNAGLSQADVAAIAKAVRDGASQAQINLDGGRVSNRLQPSLAVNTRKYSI